jgi:sucrose phosphorylase
MFEVTGHTSWLVGEQHINMNGDDSILHKLELLYPRQAEHVRAELDQLLAEFARTCPVRPAPSPRFEPADLVLICYADHVQDHGEKPLQTLRTFLHRYLDFGLAHDDHLRLHLLPFFPYSSDDGFAVSDYCSVNDRFGDWHDIQALADDYSLMFDLVLNHVSSQSEWFQRFRAGDSAYWHFFLSYAEDQVPDIANVFRPRTHPLLTRVHTARGERLVWTTFGDDQIDLNYGNPAVLLEMVRILLFYIERGARVLRLDAIAFLWKKPGTRSLHLRETHAVVQLLRQILATVAPDVWIITETNVPHRENTSYFGNGHDEAHLVYNFALPPLLLYSLMTGNASRLSAWAKSLALPSDDVAFLNFTASHDGIGITALRGVFPDAEFTQVVDALRQQVERQGGAVSMRAVAQPDGGTADVPYELNVAYLNAAGSVERFLVSQAIALALKGVPAVYFGSLIGAENWAEGLTPKHKRGVNRQKFRLGELTAELDDPSTSKHRVYEAYRRLLQARRSEPLFSPHAEQEVLDLDTRLFAIVRSSTHGRLIAMHNVSEERVTIDGTTLGAALGKSVAHDILSGCIMRLEDDVMIGPYGVWWVK